MKSNVADVLAFPLMFCVMAAAVAQEAGRPAPAPARAGLARPALLAPQDVRVFAEPPAGFREPRPGTPEGRVEAFTYRSGVTGTQRTAGVYLPPGYAGGRKYPVLYLLHGSAGNHDEWRGYVGAHTILDNLIADGKAVPMIVVMPNGRALPDDRPPPQERLFTPEHVAAFAAFERDLLEFLIPAIDAKYPTSADRMHRALAGLSMGGGQALNFGLAGPDRFAWVGGFSSAPNTRPAAQLVGALAGARAQPSLLYLSCGSKDGLIGVSRALHEALEKRAIPHVWHVDEHGHDAESWAANLYHFAQRIFR